MLAQQILNGLVSGSVYALFALGFTLIFGTHKILNLAHAGVFTMGAFIGYFAVTSGLPLWFASILAMVGAGFLSYLTELTAIRPLRKRNEVAFADIISTLGANLIFMAIAQTLSNTKVLRFPFGTFPVEFYNVFGLRVSLLQIVIACVVAALTAALIWFLYKTPFGRQVRAVSGNERTAQLLGVNPDFVYFQTFFISGALAGMCGILIGLMFNSIHFLMGEPYILRAFVVVVLGGLGSIPGAVIAGLLLGIVQTLTVAYMPSGLSETIIFSVLFVALLLRPNGLFGGAATSGGVGRK
jgi:branched-chain amino acid transport system permease protein